MVTGGAGYVGCVLVPHLLGVGYKVIVLDRFKHRSPGLLGVVGHPNLEVVRGDCRDGHTLKHCLQGADWVIPLAAIVGAPACAHAGRDEVWSVNYQSIRTLLGFRSAAQRVLFPTTNSGYGTTPSGVVCTEDTPQTPISLYGMTKTSAEYDVLQKDNTLSFRFATAFGASPRMRTDLLVNDFVLRAVRDRAVVLYEPHFRRNYIHVRDMAGAFVHAMRNWEAMAGRAYNADLPESLTKAGLCDRIKVAVPGFQYFSAPVGEDPDKRDYEVSNVRLAAAGFTPTTTVDDGILELVKAYEMFPGPEFTNV